MPCDANIVILLISAFVRSKIIEISHSVICIYAEIFEFYFCVQFRDLWWRFYFTTRMLIKQRTKYHLTRSQFDHTFIGWRRQAGHINIFLCEVQLFDQGFISLTKQRTKKQFYQFKYQTLVRILFDFNAHSSDHIGSSSLSTYGHSIYFSSRLVLRVETIVCASQVWCSAISYSTFFAFSKHSVQWNTFANTLLVVCV